MCYKLQTVETVDRTSPFIDSKARWWSAIAIFLLTPSAFDALLGGFPSEHCHGTEKQEWCGYPMVKQEVKVI